MAETAVMAPVFRRCRASGTAGPRVAHALTVSGNERLADPDGAPMDIASARSFLTAQSAALLAIVLSDPFRPRHAAAVGHALVKADFVSADVLGRSLRVLIMRLPELLRHYALARATNVRRLDGRVAEVTEALAKRLRAGAARPDPRRAGVHHARGTRRAADHQRPAKAPGDPRPLDRAGEPGRDPGQAGRRA